MALFKTAVKAVEEPEQSAPSFEYSVRANEYGFYCIPDEYRHRNVAQIIGSGNVYEPATLNFIRRQIGDGDLITGGAFIGDFFPALREVMAPDALMHSFEPNPMSYEAARETIRLNDLDGIRFHPVAVGEKPDTLVLQIARADGKKIAAGERIVADMSPEDDRGIEVDVATLDSLVGADRRVTVMHLDVEGFEMLALKGASRILKDQRPLILLEAGKPWKQKACLTTLNELVPGAGYELAGVIERNAIYRAA